MRLLKSLILSLVLILSPAVVFGAAQDYTTFTEVDENADLTVTAPKIDVTTLSTKTSTTYVYKDLGADAIEDFVAEVDWDADSFSNYTTTVSIFGVSDTVGERGSWSNGLQVGVQQSDGVGGNQVINMWEHGGSSDSTGQIGYTTKYLTIIRSDTDYTVEVYSNSARTTLIDTLNIAIASTSYRYLYGMAAEDIAGTAGRNCDGKIENLDYLAIVGEVQALVVGGGGAGGGRHGGGGAGGGVVVDADHLVGELAYSITVGAGGDPTAVGEDQSVGENGESSVFDSIVALGGGGGGSYTAAVPTGGGSGGGGGGGSNGNPTAGLANQTASGGDTGYGNDGANGATTGGVDNGGGGGGGAGADDATIGANNDGGDGGSGVLSTIYDGSNIYYGGGGGGGGSDSAGSGGTGGGGDGNINDADDGTANTGGGGGGARSAITTAEGGSGGSGIVIIRYVTADFGTCTGGTKTTDGSDTVHTFTSDGTFTVVAGGSPPAGRTRRMF